MQFFTFTDSAPSINSVAKQMTKYFLKPQPNVPRDILFLVDTTGSIGGMGNFRRLQEGVMSLFSDFCPHPDPYERRSTNMYHQAAVIQFSISKLTYTSSPPHL